MGNNGLVQKYGLASAELPSSCWHPPGYLTTVLGVGGEGYNPGSYPLKGWHPALE